MPRRVHQSVPFFRPSLGSSEAVAVQAVLTSGWLTTGCQVRQFEGDFRATVRAEHAVALNSATAALHLAVEALQLKAGQGVLLPTLTFAATAEIVRYLGGIPILVDCHPETLLLDLEDASAKYEQARNGTLLRNVPPMSVAGIIPVHVGGLMCDVAALSAFAAEHKLWVVEDAAHAFPSAYRQYAGAPWTYCGQNTARVTCFSFYANKTITTGEGGMAVTDDSDLAVRIRLMSLHGLSKDAWSRYGKGGTWDYRIIAPGFKYNLTDLAAAIGIQQLRRAEEFRTARERLALRYLEALGNIDELIVPPNPPNRLHAWHLFPIRLKLEKLRVDREKFIELLNESGIGTSVHWRPLHLHPYYEETFSWAPTQFPVAGNVWRQLISLPIFPSMTDDEQDYVVETVRHLCVAHRRM